MKRFLFLKTLLTRSNKNLLPSVILSRTTVHHNRTFNNTKYSIYLIILICVYGYSISQVPKALAGAEEQTRLLEKLDQDLNIVNDQVLLCQEMLQISVGTDNGDIALSKLIGYLEACQERMIALIEAGTNGLLTEEIFSKCLILHESILKVLETEKVNLHFLNYILFLIELVISILLDKFAILKL